MNLLSTAPLAELSPAVVAMLELIPLTVAVVFYWHRVMTLSWAGRPVPLWRQLSYGFGLFLASFVLFSPWGYLAEELVIAHMVEHLVIGDIAALFIVLGLTRSIMQPILAIRFFDRLQVLANPFVAIPLWAINLFFWHIPVMYDAAYGGALLDADTIHGGDGFDTIDYAMSEVGVEVADRDAGIGRNAAGELQLQIAQARNAQERGEIRTFVEPAALEQFVVEPAEELGHAECVALADLFKDVPEQVFEAQAGGYAAQPDRAAAGGVEIGIGVDEDLAHGRVLRRMGGPPSDHCRRSGGASPQRLMRVPSTARNWAIQAGAVTRLPSVTAWSMGMWWRSTSTPPTVPPHQCRCLLRRKPLTGC